MNIIQEATEKLISDFNAKKDQIVKDRIKELGIDVEIYEDLLKQKKIRFNPFLREQHANGYELLYFNDGSANGLFIIGFCGLDFGDPSELKMSISMHHFTEEPEWNKLPRKI